MFTTTATGLVAWAQTNVVLAVLILVCLGGAFGIMTGNTKEGKDGIRNGIIGAALAMIVVPVITALFALMPKG